MTQTVVITGASAGIGRATAREFGQRGANVVLLARGATGLDGAARDVEARGGKALAIPTDVADHSAVVAAADEAEAAFGPIDVWVNVAFTSVFAPFSQIGAEEFRRVTEVSYLGYVHGTMAALAKLLHRYLGRTGYDSQQTKKPVSRDRPNNLWQPLDQDPGTVMPVDVSDADAVFAAVDQIEREVGPIDVWVNVAFTSVFAPFSELSAEEFKRVTEVSYLGYVHGTMAALDKMRPRNKGTIVQVGSALSQRSIPLQSAYCGAKHAINGFTESIRCELFHEGSKVRITVVQMPAVNTPQFSWGLSRLPRQPQPVPPIYQPELAARAVVNSPGCCPGSPAIPSRCRRSTSRRWPPAACCMPPIIQGANNIGSATPPW